MEIITTINTDALVSCDWAGALHISKSFFAICATHCLCSDKESERFFCNALSHSEGEI